MYERLLNAATVAPLYATQTVPAVVTRTTVGLGGRGVAVGQTLLELAAKAELSELQHPDQATILVQVLSGRVELAADEASWLGGPGDLLIVPQPEHTLRALEISTVLLTAVPRAETAPWVETSQSLVARTPPAEVDPGPALDDAATFRFPLTVPQAGSGWPVPGGQRYFGRATGPLCPAARRRSSRN